MEVCSSTEMGAPGASHLGTGDHGPKTDRSRPRSVPVNAPGSRNAIGRTSQWLIRLEGSASDPDKVAGLPIQVVNDKGRFYEKVINVKADVAALLNLFSDVSIDVRW